VGIEYPVIGAISWFMAGALVKISFSQETERKVDKSNLSPVKLEKRIVLSGSVALLAISVYLLRKVIALYSLQNLKNEAS
jgi:hypothetical protein